MAARDIGFPIGSGRQADGTFVLLSMWDDEGRKLKVPTPKGTGTFNHS